MPERAAGAERVDLGDGGTSAFQCGLRPPQQQLDQGDVGQRILFVKQESSLAPHGRMPLCADERLLEAAEPRGGVSKISMDDLMTGVWPFLLAELTVLLLLLLFPPLVMVPARWLSG